MANKIKWQRHECACRCSYLVACGCNCTCCCCCCQRLGLNFNEHCETTTKARTKARRRQLLFTCGHHCGFYPLCGTCHSSPFPPPSNCWHTRCLWGGRREGKYCIISLGILKALLMRLLCLIYYSLASQGEKPAHYPIPCTPLPALALRVCQVIFALRLPDNLRRYASPSLFLSLSLTVH